MLGRYRGSLPMKPLYLLALLGPLAACTMVPEDRSAHGVPPRPVVIGQGGGGFLQPPVGFGVPAPAGPRSTGIFGNPGIEPGWGSISRRPSRPYRVSRRVVCDPATQICYKRGRIDKSETEDAFGGRAGDRADDFRDRWGRDDLYIRSRKVACDRDAKVCYKNGHADRSETREVFGKRAARRL
jgi:hypothetical protein